MSLPLTGITTGEMQTLLADNGLADIKGAFDQLQLDSELGVEEGDAMLVIPDASLSSGELDALKEYLEAGGITNSNRLQPAYEMAKAALAADDEEAYNAAMAIVYKVLRFMFEAQSV